MGQLQAQSQRTGTPSLHASSVCSRGLGLPYFTLSLQLWESHCFTSLTEEEIEAQPVSEIFGKALGIVNLMSGIQRASFQQPLHSSVALNEIRAGRK